MKVALDDAVRLLSISARSSGIASSRRGRWARSSRRSTSPAKAARSTSRARRAAGRGSQLGERHTRSRGLRDRHPSSPLNPRRPCSRPLLGAATTRSNWPAFAAQRSGNASAHAREAMAWSRMVILSLRGGSEAWVTKSGLNIASDPRISIFVLASAGGEAGSRRRDGITPDLQQYRSGIRRLPTADRRLTAELGGTYAGDVSIVDRRPHPEPSRRRSRTGR